MSEYSEGHLAFPLLSVKISSIAKAVNQIFALIIEGLVLIFNATAEYSQSNPIFQQKKNRVTSS